METVGIVILVITALALIAGIVFIFVHSELPKYKFKKEAKNDTNRVRIFAETKELLDRYNENDILKLMNLFTEVLKETALDYTKSKKCLSDVAILLTSREGFQRRAYWNYNMAASVMVWTRDKVYQKQIPMAIIHEGTLDKLQDLGGDPMFKGRPLVHEFLHSVFYVNNGGDVDASHSQKEYWGDLIRKVEGLWANR